VGRAAGRAAEAPHAAALGVKNKAQAPLKDANEVRALVAAVARPVLLELLLVLFLGHGVQTNGARLIGGGSGWQLLGRGRIVEGHLMMMWCNAVYVAVRRTKLIHHHRARSALHRQFIPPTTAGLRAKKMDGSLTDQDSSFLLPILACFFLGAWRLHGIRD
jgi:hypothetical protein